MSFEQRLNDLYIAASSIASNLVKCQKKTAAEEIYSALKHGLLGLPLLGGSVGSFLHLVHAAGAVAQGLEQMVGLVHFLEAGEQLGEIGPIEHSLQRLKENVIRKIYHLTERDKALNFARCFKQVKSFGNKNRALAKAISHHYREQLKGLSPALAKLWGEYAYLHLADLLMSGVFQKPLKSKVLNEEAILWLSYVQLRRHLPRFKTANGQNITPAESFRLPGIRFKDRQGNSHQCEVKFKQGKGNVGTQDSARYGVRHATARELAVLTKLWVSRSTQQKLSLQGAGQSFLTFKQEIFTTLQEKSFSLATELSSYQSHSQQLKSHSNQLKQLNEERLQGKKKLPEEKEKGKFIKWMGEEEFQDKEKLEHELQKTKSELEQKNIECEEKEAELQIVRRDNRVLIEENQRLTSENHQLREALGRPGSALPQEADVTHEPTTGPAPSPG